MAVTLKEDGSTDKKVLGSLTEAVKAQSSVEADWSRLKTIFASPELQMVSFTITEKDMRFMMQRESFSHSSRVILIMDLIRHHLLWQL